VTVLRGNRRGRLSSLGGNASSPSGTLGRRRDVPVTIWPLKGVTRRNDVVAIGTHRSEWRGVTWPKELPVKRASSRGGGVGTGCAQRSDFLGSRSEQDFTKPTRRNSPYSKGLRGEIKGKLPRKGKRYFLRKSRVP